MPADPSVPVGEPRAVPAKHGLEEDSPHWPLWIAPAGVLLGFVLAAFGSVMVDVIAHLAGGSLDHPGPAATIASDIVFDLCFVGTAIWLTGWHGRRRLVDFGYRRTRVRTGVRAVLLGAVGYYGVTAIYGALLSTKQSDRLPSDLGVTHSTAALIAASVFVCAIAPMAEEIFFRGFFFGSLRRLHIPLAGREVGPWIAAVVTGILFGLAHFDSAQPEFLIPLGFLGFVLCLVRWRTGSLYPGMALHSANNALALGVQLHWSVPGILALVVASWALIAAVVWPLGARTPALA
jgi:membrane protease YdiL (CAAX protease family)